MGRGEDKELLQVYRVLVGEVVRERKNERLLEEATEVCSRAHAILADANVEIATLRGELKAAENEAARNRSEAQRCKALDVILADERDDADEAALWLEAIAILSEPAASMKAGKDGFPPLCLTCGGNKGTGGMFCWPCWRLHAPVTPQLSEQWWSDGRRDFPRKTP